MNKTEWSNQRYYAYVSNDIHVAQGKYKQAKS